MSECMEFNRASRSKRVFEKRCGKRVERICRPRVVGVIPCGPMTNPDTLKPVWYVGFR